MEFIIVRIGKSIVVALLKLITDSSGLNRRNLDRYSVRKSDVN